jgi:hypothetical protein
VQEWINVNDLLPKPGQKVRVMLENGSTMITRIIIIPELNKFEWNDEDEKITHWQTLSL